MRYITKAAIYTWLLLALSPQASAAIALVANNIGQETAGLPPVVTVNGTGGSLGIVCLADDQGNAGTAVVTDSLLNTWVRANRNAGANAQVELFYAENFTGGVGQTFTTTANFATLSVTVWSGAATSSVLDGTAINSAGSGGVTSIQPGSATPANANSLMISCLAVSGGTGGYSASGFTISNDAAQIPGQAYSAGQAYLVQTSATAENPTWSSWASTDAAANIAAFKSAGGGGAAPARHQLLVQ